MGICDVDVCGPSIPLMMRALHGEVHQSAEGWQPVYVRDNLAVMSIGKTDRRQKERKADEGEEQEEEKDGKSPSRDVCRWCVVVWRKAPCLAPRCS